MMFENVKFEILTKNAKSVIKKAAPEQADRK